MVVAALILNGSLVLGQSAPVATFKSSVDLVRVTATVRDRRGRLVRNLSARDFEIVDAGERRQIVDFRNDAGAISIALLFDVSGSMEKGLSDARETASHILSWLDTDRDEAAVYAFDTHLDEVLPFTPALQALPPSLASVTPFGATSLHDAIAQTAERVGQQEGRRRAVAVLTDGNDTASRLKPSEVSAIASAIDVPVYIFGVVSPIDDPASEVASSAAGRSPLAGALEDLASWTGGRVFVVSTPGQRSLAARQLVEELRHQYLMAIEASDKPGWHRLTVRTYNGDLSVRSRSGYFGGQYRLKSF